MHNVVLDINSDLLIVWNEYKYIWKIPSLLIYLYWPKCNLLIWWYNPKMPLIQHVHLLAALKLLLKLKFWQRIIFSRKAIHSCMNIRLRKCHLVLAVSGIDVFEDHLATLKLPLLWYIDFSITLSYEIQRPRYVVLNLKSCLRLCQMFQTPLRVSCPLDSYHPGW